MSDWIIMNIWMSGKRDYKTAPPTSNFEYSGKNSVQAVKRSIKRQKAIFFLNISGLAWQWDPRGSGTYSKFVQSPLMIDGRVSDFF